ncbi:hypothetical protein A3K72_00345 [Candidatus Woesearchaeota archaeon RBG_13_36_6]|nr:MAG: hypothetical protein A3K72_00345 [Candidatus Woesearchaeota archaeon RBG_13_36_6]
MKWLKPGNNNNRDRMNFVKYWADYVRTHPDDLWSKQQNVLIDSQISGARRFKHSPKKYLKIKNEPYS